jgi:SAM-dependent methyltransferase
VPDVFAGHIIEADPLSIDNRLSSPSFPRNHEPIAAVLARLLPAQGSVLELASGSGEHAVAFARQFDQLSWQPSDPDPAARASVAQRRLEAGLANLGAPLDIDVTGPNWPKATFDAIVCINMLHISPWSAAEGLMAGARRVLRPSGGLYLYGPFLRQGYPTAPSNLGFDSSLRERDSRWGLRLLEDVTALAETHTLELRQVVEMPANNLSVWFEKTEKGPHA